MTKFLGAITAFLVLFTIGFLNCLLAAYIVLDVANLYKIAFITQFSSLQLIGIFCILAIVSFKRLEDKKHEDNSISATFLRSLGHVLTITTFYLCSWGLAILYFNVLS